MNTNRNEAAAWMTVLGSKPNWPTLLNTDLVWKDDAGSFSCSYVVGTLKTKWFRTFLLHSTVRYAKYKITTCSGETCLISWQRYQQLSSANRAAYSCSMKQRQQSIQVTHSISSPLSRSIITITMAITSYVVYKFSISRTEFYNDL